MVSFKEWLELESQSRGKHRKDYNHGKGGYVGGNPRYSGKKSGSWKAGVDPRKWRKAEPPRDPEII